MMTRHGALVVASLVASVATVNAGPGPAGARPLRQPEPVTRSDPAEGLSPLDLREATFGQRAESFVLELSTHGPWRPADLDATVARSLCILLAKLPADPPYARLCVRHDANRKSRLALRLSERGPNGLVVRDLAAEVFRVGANGIRATLSPAELRVRPGQYAWQARSEWTDAGSCATRGACDDVLPDAGPVQARYVPLGPVVGCGFEGARQVTRAAGSPNEVALTFDDGPSAYTAGFLRVLRREGVRGTFFLVGSAVRGRRALVRRMVRDGHMVANHSLTHANLGSGGPRAAYELRRTQAIIRAATGFTPCLFRPPYGATSRELVRRAGAQRLTTVLWDVDPQDWTTPGTGSIVGRIQGKARRGSIVLMHDGGGPRGQTLAALPQVIRTFKRRHYRFVTLDEMLGLGPVRAREGSRT